jgi:cellulose biosynthesis protein BcsQ
MQVWALVQQKGGSDKSTICTNLAVLALQERYRRLVTGLKPLLEHLPDALGSGPE